MIIVIGVIISSMGMEKWYNIDTDLIFIRGMNRLIMYVTLYYM